MKLHTIAQLLLQPFGTLAITDSGVMFRVVLTEDNDVALAFQGPYDTKPERNYLYVPDEEHLTDAFTTTVVWSPEG